MEVKILQESLPVIQINFDEMKSALTETLKNYEGIVVTEETLSSCKTTQKELAGARVKIDNYRKDKKKILSKPITDFENQCKDLITLIEQVEQPIKDGIKVFDDEKRDLKRNHAIELSKEVAEEYELNDKYAARLQILDKYCNLTTKSNEVKDDLSSQAIALKVEQDREAELIEIIKDTIESENEKIKRKMQFEDFQRYIDRGLPTKDVIAEIRLASSRIYEAENPKQEVKEVTVEPLKQPTTNETKEVEQTYYANYKVVGTHSQLLTVSKFLKANRITYEVTDQGQIWKAFCKLKKSAI